MTLWKVDFQTENNSGVSSNLVRRDSIKSFLTMNLVSSEHIWSGTVGQNAPALGLNWNGVDKVSCCAGADGTSVGQHVCCPGASGTYVDNDTLTLETQPSKSRVVLGVERGLSDLGSESQPSYRFNSSWLSTNCLVRSTRLSCNCDVGRCSIIDPSWSCCNAFSSASALAASFRCDKSESSDSSSAFERSMLAFSLAADSFVSPQVRLVVSGVVFLVPQSAHPHVQLLSLLVSWLLQN